MLSVIRPKVVTRHAEAWVSRKQRSPSIARAQLSQGANMQVLIVEDDFALGLFLQKGLKLEGHNVEWVGDGESAVSNLMSQPRDLLVLDLSLPKKDGVEVLEAIAGKFHGMAVLVLTGNSLRILF
jgi:CheY-like chemotaxis protein